MKKILVTLSLVAFFITNSMAGEGVIAAKDLFKIMNSNDVVIVSAQKQAEYQKVHIKNAIHIDHKTLYKEDGPKSMLKSSADLARIFGEKGISNTSTIVVYDQGSGKYAGRLYWIFKYMGCENVKILDGQLNGWMKARKPITKNPTSVSKATFTPKVNSSAIATISDVKSGKYLLLDVRAAGEYNGSEGDTEQKGHIPGAKNMEYKKILNEDGTFKSKEEIQAIVSKVGISSDKPVILYCTSSVRAGIVYAALTDILEYTQVKVYDGAFYEWIAKGNKID